MNSDRSVFQEIQPCSSMINFVEKIETFFSPIRRSLMGIQVYNIQSFAKTSENVFLIFAGLSEGIITLGH